MNAWIKHSLLVVQGDAIQAAAAPEQSLRLVKSLPRAACCLTHEVGGQLGHLAFQPGAEGLIQGGYAGGVGDVKGLLRRAHDAVHPVHRSLVHVEGARGGDGGQTCVGQLLPDEGMDLVPAFGLLFQAGEGLGEALAFAVAQAAIIGQYLLDQRLAGCRVVEQDAAIGQRAHGHVEVKTGLGQDHQIALGHLELLRHQAGAG